MSGLATARRSVGNAWSHYVGGGVEPHVPTPSRKVHDEPHAVLRRYDALDATGDPILLVPPLAVHITCFDLRANQSLAAFLVATGRPVYVVDFGDITFADRAMGFEDWIDRILPDDAAPGVGAPRRTSRRRRHLEPRRHADPADRRRPRRPAVAGDRRGRPRRSTTARSPTSRRCGPSGG